MPEKVAYKLADIPKIYPVSEATLRRAIHTTDPNAFPPPLKAKRMGRGSNAKYVVWSEDLKAWHELLPEA